jgi:hypothetical protein
VDIVADPVCTDCEAGKHQAAAGATACATCGVGTYSGAPASSVCSSCSAGKYNVRAGLYLPTVDLTCGGAKCGSSCVPRAGASSGTISDGRGLHSNNVNCWWLLATTAVTEIRIRVVQEAEKIACCSSDMAYYASVAVEKKIEQIKNIQQRIHLQFQDTNSDIFKMFHDWNKMIQSKKDILQQTLDDAVNKEGKIYYIQNADDWMLVYERKKNIKFEWWKNIPEKLEICAIIWQMYARRMQRVSDVCLTVVEAATADNNALAKNKETILQNLEKLQHDSCSLFGITLPHDDNTQESEVQNKFNRIFKQIIVANKLLSTENTVKEQDAILHALMSEIKTDCQAAVEIQAAQPVTNQGSVVLAEEKHEEEKAVDGDGSAPGDGSAAAEIQAEHADDGDGSAAAEIKAEHADDGDGSAAAETQAEQADDGDGSTAAEIQAEAVSGASQLLQEVMKAQQSVAHPQSEHLRACAVKKLKTVHDLRTELIHNKIDVIHDFAKKRGQVVDDLQKDQDLMYKEYCRSKTSIDKHVEELQNKFTLVKSTQIDKLPDFMRKYKDRVVGITELVLSTRHAFNAFHNRVMNIQMQANMFTVVECYA